MIHLKTIALRSGQELCWPFDVPAVANLGEQHLDAPVLFFVGENGSGKSTLLESLAMATRRVTVGAADAATDPSLACLRPLAEQLRLGWRQRTHRGFFLRAEDVFNYCKRNRDLGDEMQNLADRYADDARVRGYMLGQKNALTSRYGGDLENLSHGESFLALFQSRVVPGGLYLLDEPEAALSPKRQLALLALIKQMVEESECQFIIATHSPILLSYPDAMIWLFDESGVVPTQFDDIEHVSFTREFLAAPERFWRHL